MNRKLAAEQVAYQQYMEAARPRPDREHLQEDLAKGARAVEIAWLERTVHPETNSK